MAVSCCIASTSICKSKNILDSIQEHRIKQGYSGLNDSSYHLFKDAIKAVFIQLRNTFFQLKYTSDNIVHFYEAYYELATSTAHLNPQFDELFKYNNEHFKIKECIYYQTNILYKKICYFLQDCNQKLFSKENNEFYSSLYYWLKLIVCENPLTAKLFLNKVNFHAVEMVVTTLKGGY